MRHLNVGAAIVLIWLSIGDGTAMAQALSGGATTEAATLPVDNGQIWNLHTQGTIIVQGDPAFSGKYSGPNSLTNTGEVKETISLDVFSGLRLWSGAEVHVDGMLWQGIGLSNAKGVEDFPNSLGVGGTDSPAFTFARLFIRQTIGLGGQEEDVADDQLMLAGKRDVSRVTFTLGRFAATDLFDVNDYAGDAENQFMNEAFVTNVAWDYPADPLGYTTGLAVELNQQNWALRGGFFQMPGMERRT
jgi:high affinity Mn2+ porin